MIRGLLVATVLLALGCGGGRHEGPELRRPSGPHSPSVGFIDTPKDGDTVAPILQVAGWAANDAGVDAVRIYFDDDLITTFPINVARPDVDKVYPRFARLGPIHGFGGTVNASAHSGYCVIRAVAIDGQGGQTQVQAITVKIGG